MLYVQFTNPDLDKVAKGMMAVMECFDVLPQRPNRGEKCAILAACFKAMMDGDMGDEISPGAALDIVSTMEKEAKRTKIPEFGAAVNYVKRELTSLRGA